MSDEISQIEFIDGPPPPTTRGPRGGKWAKEAAALRAQPGAWAIVSVEAFGGNTAKRRRAYGPGFETATRKRPDGKVAVYARYVGEDAS